MHDLNNYWSSNALILKILGHDLFFRKGETDRVREIETYGERQPGGGGGGGWTEER